MEVVVDVRLEFGDTRMDRDENKVLAFSDGSLIAVCYDNEGCWRFDVRSVGTSKPNKTYIATDSDGDEYSDVIEFEGPIKWVVLGKKGD